MRKIVVALIIGCLSAGAAYAVDYSGYKKNVDFYLNPIPLNLSGNIADFPLMIRIIDPADSIFLLAQASGADIRFSKEDGITPLVYEIERFSQVNKQAIFWIKIDVVDKSSVLKIKMHYGNSSVTVSESDPTSVFVNTKFQAAYHFNEKGTNDGIIGGDTITKFKDATSNNFLAKMDSVLYRAQEIDPPIIAGGVNSYQTSGIVNIPGLSWAPSAFSISYWIYPFSNDYPDANNFNSLNTISKTGTAANGYYQKTVSGGPWGVKTGSNVSTTMLIPIDSTGFGPNNSWMLMTYTFDGINGRFYKNGNLVGGPTSQPVSAAWGGFRAAPTGFLDELRFNKSVISADEAKLTFETQRLGQTTLTTATKAGFSPSTAAGYNPQIITFTDNSTGAITSWKWRFSNNPADTIGYTVRKTTQAHTFADTGAFTVWLIIRDQGVVDSTSTTISIKGVKASFLAPNATGYAPFTPTFTDNSLGSIVSWKWRFSNNPADTVGYTTTKATQSHTFADSGTFVVWLIVRGTTTQDSVSTTIKVFPTAIPVDAKFGSDRILSAAPATITFTDSSTGTITKWLWSFGNGNQSMYDVRVPTKTVTYTDTGHYKVKLVVSGPGPAGSDSSTIDIVIANPSFNGVSIVVSPLSSSQVVVSYAGKLPVASSPITLGADSVRLYFRPGGTPIDPLTNAVVAKYSVRAMGKQVGDTVTIIFKDTVNVPPSTKSTEQYYGFWAGATWNNGTLSPYVATDAQSVAMKPRNQLVPSGKYLGNTAVYPSVVPDSSKADSAIVTLGNGSTLTDTNSISVTLSIIGKNGALIPDETIDRATFVSQLVTGSYSKRIKSQLLFSDTQTVSVIVRLAGRNGVVSDSVKSSFVAGFPRIANQSTLVVDTINAFSVKLSWLPAPLAQKMRMLISRGPFVAGQVPTDTLQIRSIASPSATPMLVTGLDQNTQYYFALQTQNNLLWSDIVVAKTASAKTLLGSGSVLTNSIKIAKTTFNATTNSIDIEGTLTPIKNSSISIGSSVSVDSAAVRATTPSSQAIDIGAAASFAFSIPLESKILFNTKYYVGLWLRDQSGGPWSPPFDSSCSSAATGNYTFQTLSYGDTSAKQVYGFNSNVVVRKDLGFVAPTGQDTLKFSQPVGSADLIPVGVGFSLAQWLPTVTLGLRYDSLPSGYTSKDIGIYSVNEAGAVSALYNVTLDQATSTLWFKPAAYVTAGKRIPFQIMLDTKRPKLSFASEQDTGEVLITGANSSDTISIGDQIVNVSWKLQYAKDGAAFTDDNTGSSKMQTGFICGNCATPEKAILAIDNSFITEENGLRARLIISDGPHSDTVNISRRVKRIESDVIAPEANVWTPIAVTANLDSIGIGAALSGLAKQAGIGDGNSGWIYDNKKMRLYKWGGLDWNEFTSLSDTTFKVLPGRLFWLKTKNSVQFNFGDGVTLSQKDTVDVGLAPQNQWTDINVPYKYDLKIGDVLKASGITGDSLAIYAWDLDPVTKKFKTKLVFWGLADTKKDLADSLKGTSGFGYSILNKSASAKILRFPPLPASMSSIGASVNKEIVGNSFGVDVVATSNKDGQKSSVRCAFVLNETSNASTIPLTPSFGTLSIGAIEPLTKRQASMFVYHKLDNGLALYTLVLHNDADNDQHIMLTTENANLSAQQKVFISTDDGNFIPFDQPLSVMVPKSSDVQKSIIIATEDFKRFTILKNLKLSLVGCYPNPFKNLIVARFSIPQSGVGLLGFELLDFKGRVVRQTVLSGMTRGMVGSFRWNLSSKPLTPGMYILRMKAFDVSGNVLGVFTSRLSCAY